MYDDNEEQLDKYDKALKKYTREEFPIYDEEVYEALLNRYPLEEDTIVYRGLNFSSRLDYHKFMKRFSENDGYISVFSSGFSKIKSTAEEFALSPKSFFLDKEVMAAHAKKNKEAERLSGYCGVLLSFKAKAGSVINVNKSDYAVEDEVLIRPSELVKCDVILIPNYKNLIKNENIDVNEYIQNCDNTSDGLFNYIIKNHSLRLNSDSADHILNMCLDLEERNNNRYKSCKNSQDDNLIHSSRYFSVVKRVHMENAYRNYEKKDRYHLYCPEDVMFYEKLGCFRPKQYEKIKSVADEILIDFFDVHYDLGQKEDIYDLNPISWYAKFASEHLQDLYKNKILTRNNTEAQRIVNSSMDINNLPENKKRDAIRNNAEDIKDVLTRIITEKMKPINKSTKRLSGIKKDS